MKLYSAEFAADPHAAYRRMRADHGPLAPVEVAPGVAATLVIGYREALQIFADPAHFPTDPRAWQSGLGAGCPVPAALSWRPDALRTDGEEHARYRQAIADALAGIDLHALHAAVERTAVAQLNDFCADGSAELLGRFAVPVTVTTLEQVLGLGPAAGERAFAAVLALREADGDEAAAGAHRMLVAAMDEVVAAKRGAPGQDVATRLLRHPAELTDTEAAHQLALLYATGAAATWNLIANTVLLMATDERFRDGLLGGAIPIRDVIDEVQFTDPPLANSCPSYPRRPQMVGTTWLAAHQPVLISLAACNNDPAAVNADRRGNRSHLAWGAGAHACPAQPVATVIVQEALDQLLDALPELRLAVESEELRWLPSPFHRAPASLPVRFPPSPPLPLP